MSSLIAKRYVKALLELKDISVDEILESLSAIAEVINSDKKTMEFLKSPLVKNEDKYKAIIEPISDKLNEKIVALLKLMAQKGRLALIPDLVNELKKEIQAKSNSYNGVVISKDDVDETLIEKLEKKLSSYSGADVKLSYQKGDIDGVRAEVADLGLELNFSKERVKEALIEHIEKAL